MTFDVTQFELEETAVLTVQNAAGTDDLLVDGQPVTIVLYGTGSKQSVKALHKAGKQVAKRMQAIFRGKDVETTAEDADREQVEKLIALTESVNNFPIEGGAKALYSNPKLGYITKQVIKFLDDDANFTKGSTKT